MLILYNPKHGAPISSFNFNGAKIQGDKNPDVVLAVGELAQFESALGEFMVKQWAFLLNVTPTEAKKILEKPKEAEYKCQYCDFATDVKVALMNHMKNHKEEIAKGKEPAIDPSLIPVIEGKPINESMHTSTNPTEDIAIQSGTKIDGDGVQWYGPGSTEEPRSQSRIPPIGTGGHFGGGV